ARLAATFRDVTVRVAGEIGIEVFAANVRARAVNHHTADADVAAGARVTASVVGATFTTMPTAGTGFAATAPRRGRSVRLGGTGRHRGKREDSAGQAREWTPHGRRQEGRRHGYAPRGTQKTSAKDYSSYTHV